MGGGYYDRDVGEAEPTAVYSATAAAVIGTAKTLNCQLDPKKYVSNRLSTSVKNPIVFALDVTGSMGDWTKIIYDKMPMFYGQIMLENYLEEPAISFCAIGDCTCDEAPLQVSPFCKGKEIDGYLAKMYLEGGGGGSYYESYEFAGYFYLHYSELDDPEFPFFFITGDEGFYEKSKPQYIQKFLGVKVNEMLSGKEVWKELLKKYNIFLIKKDYEEPKKEAIIQKQWAEALGEERILDIVDAKACIDIMLGAIALTSRARNLNEYALDMRKRGQTNERIEQVKKALKKYNDKLQEYLGKAEANEANIEVSEKVIIESSKQAEPQIPEGDFLEAKQKAEEEHLSSLDLSKKKMKQNLKMIKYQFGEAIPEELLCPITSEIFIEPVMTCDGHTYEKAAIESWLSKHNTSPKTNLPLENKVLIPNFVIKQLVKTFHDENIKKI